MRRLTQSILGGSKFRLRRVATRVVAQTLPYLPDRLVLNILMFAQAVNLPGQRLLLLHLIAATTARSGQKPQISLTTNGAKRMPVASSQVLYALGRHQDAITAIQQLKPGARTKAATLLMARALFELGEFERARALLTNSGGEEAFDFDPPTAHLRGLLELCAGNESDADGALRTATAAMPNLMAPHQNLAARDPFNYRPTRLDIVAGRDGRLFDAYNYLGQRVVHVGMGQFSTGMYAKAFEAQRRIQKTNPSVSSGCASYLADLGTSLTDIKVFASEWQTQIGHQGLLDIELRMRELGWWKGEPIVLVDRGRVANFAFLSLFEHRAKMLSVGGSLPRDIARELISLQRYCGRSFNAFEMPDGTVAPWSEAGALAIRQWEDEGRQPPLQAEFDRKFGSSETLAATLDQARRSWGMTPNDWYVCLHLRDAAFYGEAHGFGQSHRNSNVENYQAAIEYITGLGGWVIKLGGKASPKLPQMPRVVDYSSSEFKSDLMDIALIRHARIFIGTTSGLTNAAISLGVPAALVNCISTDAQIWHRQVRFAPKRIVLRDGHALSQAELTLPLWRWRLFDAAVLARHGATPTDSTSDEVLETVKEVLALATGKNEDPAASIELANELTSQWQESLSMPHFYGNAQISLYYLNKHRASLLAPIHALGESHLPPPSPGIETVL
jgi:putative glycosyltransferase (TIGR04372 family)